MSVVSLPVTALLAALIAVTVPALGISQVVVDSMDVHDLPLTEVPARGDGHTLGIVLSGDGGWAAIDKQIAAEMAARGIPVVGVNLRSYLGKERTPDETATDLMRVIRVYRARWKCDRIVIVGYSRGANIAPFAVARFPEALRHDIDLIGLIGLAPAANFKWHLEDLIRDVKRSSDLPVRPELDRITAIPTLCIFGADEKDSGCRTTPPSVTRIERTGGHHLDGDYKAVADMIVDAIKR